MGDHLGAGVRGLRGFEGWAGAHCWLRARWGSRLKPWDGIEVRWSSGGLCVGPVEGLEDHPSLKEQLCGKYNHVHGQEARNPDPEPGSPPPVIHPGLASLLAHRDPGGGPRASPQEAQGLSPYTYTPQASLEGRGEPRPFLSPH